MKTTRWPSADTPASADDPFGDLRAAYFTRLRSDLAQLTALRAKHVAAAVGAAAGAGAASKKGYEAIRRIAHGMAGAAAIFKAGDVMRAAVMLEQAVRSAKPGADDETVRLALDEMIDSLRSICAAHAAVAK